MNSVKSIHTLATPSKSVTKTSFFHKEMDLATSGADLKGNGDPHLKIDSKPLPLVLPVSSKPSPLVLPTSSSLRAFQDPAEAHHKHEESDDTASDISFSTQEGGSVGEVSRYSSKYQAAVGEHAAVIITRIPARFEDDIMYDVAIKYPEDTSILRLTPREVSDQIRVLQGRFVFSLARGDTGGGEGNVYLETMDPRVAGAAVIQDARHQLGPGVTHGMTMIKAAHMVILRDCPTFNQRYGFGQQAGTNTFSALKSTLNRLISSSPPAALYHVITKPRQGALMRRKAMTAKQVQHYMWNENTDECLFSLLLVDNLADKLQARTLTENPWEVETLVLEDSQKKLPSLWNSLLRKP